MNNHQRSSSCPWLHSLLQFLLAASLMAAEERDIYLVLVEGEPVAFHQSKGFSNGSLSVELTKAHAARLIEAHDELLHNTLDLGAYSKLYSFHHIANGFAVHTTQSQAERLRAAAGVVHVERDRRAKLMTTYTPHALGLPEGVWRQAGGEEHAGEGIVIGVIDTGIDPAHPSFAYDPRNCNFDQFSGVGACDGGPFFPEGSCNGKIVSARYFSAGAAAVIPLDESKDLSPFDEVGHGSHVAAIAAGNWEVSVVVDGFKYGTASGMAPRARLAVYKALYPGGGTIADVVSAIDQAAQDKVDVLVLSIGPDEPPEDTITFMNVFDIFLLFARRAGIFVAQAAGNKGPGESTVVSFSPWAMGVASSTTSRFYTATLMLGDGRQIHGIGLSEFEDYISFLCSLPNIDPARVQSATGRACSTVSPSSPVDLNLPSATVSALRGFQVIKRRAKNVGSEPETYVCSVLPPEGVEVDVQPLYFTVDPQGTQELDIKLNATTASEWFSFGEITLTGSLNHIVRLPLSVWPISVH